MDKRVVDFNKEILIGEVGGLITIPIVSFITSAFTQSANIISTAAVLAALFGASLFWILARAYDDKKRNLLNINNLVTDIGYFTPAAFIGTVVIYYPTLFLVSRRLLNANDKVIPSVIVGQFCAFALFIIAMNIYHHYLFKLSGKDF